MKNLFLLPLTMISLLGTAVLVGCNGSEPTPPTNNGNLENQATESAKDDIESAIAELPEADQHAARAQKNCPVTDEPLGSMGVPIKVEVEGREVFVCCEGCIDELKSDFAKYSSKLNSSL